MLKLFLLLLLFCASAQAGDLQVFAAASLSDALKEIAGMYEQRTATHVLYNFAASSILARQIEEGSPADVFFSADEEIMDALKGKGLILPETRKSLLSNTLVIVIPSDSASSLKNPQDLASSRWKIAIAEPSSVPAGIYAKKYLQHLQVWDAVKDRVIPTDNVRAALAAVESGNVDAGIVYRTDAALSRRVKIAYQIPADQTPGISYPVSVTSESKNRESAKSFVSYLAGEDAKAIFRKYGFIVR